LTTFKCRLCRSDAVACYTPLGSKREATVSVCSGCGATQSHFGLERVLGEAPRVSGNADWANVRHGKSLRVDRLWPRIEDLMQRLGSQPVLLDDGASRGRLLEMVKRTLPSAYVMAVEPHQELLAGWNQSADWAFPGYLEEAIDAAPSKAHVAVCLHTLEHTEDPVQHLMSLWTLLEPGGSLVLEVPSLTHALRRESAEEFFIDSHTIHFEDWVLEGLLRRVGFEDIRWVDVDDANLTLTARRAMGPISTRPSSETHLSPAASASRLAAYEGAMLQARGKLGRFAGLLSALQEQERVILFGAGRLLHLLVELTGYTPKVDGIVDNYLVGIVDSVLGIPVVGSDDINFKAADYVVVLLTDSSTESVRRDLKGRGVRRCLHLSEFDVEVNGG